MRLSRITALAAAAFLPLMAVARPASPRLLQHVNPDGSKVKYRLFGDESFSYMTDADESTILEFNTARELRPAMRDGRVLSLTDANVDRLRLETPAPLTQIRAHAPETPAGMSRMAALTLEGRSTYPTTGDVHGLVVLLNFKDRKFSIDNPIEHYEKFCNLEGYSEYGARGSVKDYYKASSNGNFSPTFDIVGPVELKDTAGFYNGYDVYLEYDEGKIPGMPGGAGRNYRFGYAIKEALEALDKTVDFSKYDYDDDGVIDNIFFFYAGYGQADGGGPSTIWPHQGDYGSFIRVHNLPSITVDGKRMGTYACSNELDGYHKNSPEPWPDGIGAFCHEYGHVIGLPDLYDVQYSGKVKTPGAYSVMDSGSYNDGSNCPPLFSGYEQWVCNWLEFDDNDGGETDVTLYPLTTDNRNATRLRIRQPGNSYYPEYFVLEARDKKDWDLFLPQHGMFIWRINYNRSTWNSNKVNTGSCNVELIFADDQSNTVAWPGNYGEFNVIYPSMNVLVPASTRRAADFVLSEITRDTATGNVTFGLNKYKQGNLRVALDDQPEVDTGSRAVTLKWEKADSDFDVTYAVTMYREDNYGNRFYIAGMNEFNVGNVNEYTVKNLSSSNMKQEITAYIRVYDPLPSGVVSNTIKFIPGEVGVEGVEAEIPVIYGGEGCVIAPEDARVFNLSGIETGRENLAPGVYIVVCGNATAKVSVR